MTWGKWTLLFLALMAAELSGVVWALRDTVLL